MGTGRSTEAGMTLTELLVVVVILGVLATTALPMFGRDRSTQSADAFSEKMVRNFQQARFQAISERLPVRAFVFSDRVEWRSAIQGANPADPPEAATLDDPTYHVLMAGDRVEAWDVKTDPGPPGSAQLSSSTHQIIEWNSLGQTRIVDVAGNGIHVFLRDNSKPGATGGRYRIDIAPLTGAVNMTEGW